MHFSAKSLIYWRNGQFFERVWGKIYLFLWVWLRNGGGCMALPALRQVRLWIEMYKESLSHASASITPHPIPSEPCILVKFAPKNIRLLKSNFIQKIITLKPRSLMGFFGLKVHFYNFWLEKSAALCCINKYVFNIFCTWLLCFTITMLALKTPALNTLSVKWNYLISVW